MQFSKRVSELARSYNVEPKEVLFALLISAGASNAEAFAVIFRPPTATTASLNTRCSNYIGQRPPLRRLINELLNEAKPITDNGAEPQPLIKKSKAGRPIKDKTDKADVVIDENTPSLDYTDKDAVLKELALIAERCEKDSDRLAALREISALQRMKAEAAVEEKKAVQFYVPRSYIYCDRLLSLLEEWKANNS